MIPRGRKEGSMRGYESMEKSLKASRKWREDRRHLCDGCEGSKSFDSGVKICERDKRYECVK